MMTNYCTQAAEALARLAEKPWALFVVLLTINTIAQPYAGITHDARLYSVQVLNRVEHGAYADDLFFRYGSQDDYSLFSRLAAPLVHVLGLSTAFFVIYLVSKSLLIYGMMRLVQSLVPNPAAATLALFYCMAFQIHYGGHHMLFVQENFVTPRMLACALVLIGLDMLLRNRPIASGLAVTFAVGLHPLMGFGGLMIWGGFHLWKYLGVTTFIGALTGAGILAIVVLMNESLGKRCFGEMDDLWRQTIMQGSPFNFPSLWDWGDWLGIAFQLAILGVVIWNYRSVDADKARFLVILGFVTIAGAFGAIFAEQLPYALLLQGQPYRAMWMLAFVHLAFVVWLCGEWSKQGRMAQLAGCVLLAYLCCINGLLAELALPILLLPLLAVILRGLDKEPQNPDWLIRSIQCSLVLGAIGWGVYKFFLLARGYEELLTRHAEHRDIVEILLRNLGPIVFCALFCWLLARVDGGTDPAVSLRSPAGLVSCCAAACLAVQTFCYAFPETDFYLENCTKYRGDLKKVHAMLHDQRSPSQPLPTVYCNLGCLDYVWLDLHSKSYFDWWQAGNFMFRREMAMEGRRRAALVGPCEIAHYRQFEDQLSPGYKDVVARFFQTDFQREPLNKADLARLCQEPSIDHLVLDQPVDGVTSVQVGRLFVYSCRDVRLALGLPNSRLASRP